MNPASSLVAVQLDIMLSSTLGATDSLRKKREEKRSEAKRREEKRREEKRREEKRREEKRREMEIISTVGKGRME